MKIFKLCEVYSIICECKPTRNGFKHIASLFKNGLLIYDTKVCYLNRTYERFEYETILLKVIDNFMASCDRQKYREVIKNFT